MRKNGFSILELLITLVIVSLIMSAAYYTYTEIFRGMKEESESVELQMEKVIGTELLRLDAEHLGYGVGYDSTDKIVEWNGSELTIRSTLNNTRQETFGWVLCADGTMVADERKDPTNNNIVYISTITGAYSSVVNDGSCPATGVHVGFPFVTEATACSVGGTNTCNTIKYRLSGSDLPAHCNPNTKNLLRVVNNDSGDPLISCVADFKVSFELDTDKDGQIDCVTTSSSCSLPTSNSELSKQVKRVNLYILMQEGGLNKNYTYPGSNPTIDGITLNLPANYLHYRWKVIKISVKPMGLFGGVEFTLGK